MKKVLSGLLVLVLSLTFVQVVSAQDGISGLSLSCPAKVNAGDTVSCSLSGNVVSNVTRIASIVVQSTKGKIDSFPPIDPEPLSIGDGVKLADFSFSTTTSGGTAQFTLGVNYYTSGNPSKMLTATVKSKEIKVVSGSGSGSGSGSDSGSSSSTPTTPVVKNSKLKDLKVNGTTVNGFNSNVKTYSLSTSSSVAEITATKAAAAAKVQGAGSKALSCGNNTFTITVTNGSSTTKYTLNIKRKCATNVNLAGIEVSEGTLSPNFNKDITNYIVKVGKDVETITVTGKKANDNQTIIGNVVEKRLKPGANKIKLIVTASNGNKKSYIVNVIKESKDALLKSITLSEGEINFDKNTFDYNIEVLNDVNNIEVLAVPEDAAAIVTVTGNNNLQVGDNIIAIKVELDDAKTKIYTIKVNKLKDGESFGTNPNIKSIRVIGYNLKFDYDKTDYKLVIKQEDSLDIEIIMDDENATYEIIGNENLKNGSIISIIGKSSSGEAKEYTIAITKSNYTVSYIIGISLIILAIALPLVVYFVSVRKKKELVDVNGYKISKEEQKALKKSKTLEKVKKTVSSANSPERIDEEILKPQAIITDAGKKMPEPKVEQPAVAETPAQPAVEQPIVTDASAQPVSAQPVAAQPAAVQPTTQTLSEAVQANTQVPNVGQAEATNPEVVQVPGVENNEQKQ